MIPTIAPVPRLRASGRLVAAMSWAIARVPNRKMPNDPSGTPGLVSGSRWPCLPARGPRSMTTSTPTNRTRVSRDARLSMVRHRAGAGTRSGGHELPVCRARPRAPEGREGDARHRGFAVRPGANSGRGRSQCALSSLDRPHVRPFPAASPVVVGTSAVCVDDPRDLLTDSSALGGAGTSASIRLVSRRTSTPYKHQVLAPVA